MTKRGNYFIAMYDKEDNYICDFDSIEQCAIYFNTTKKIISCYLFKKMKLKNEYKLFKITDDYQSMEINKSL